MINILALGDVVGRPGRRALQSHLSTLKAREKIDVVVVNGENSAGGAGIDFACAREIRDSGADFITLGDHTWQRSEAEPLLNDNPDWIIRPANYPPSAAGRGYAIKEIAGLKIGVINLMGRVFINQFLDCPFRTAGALLSKELKGCDVIICDMHAEATSEKKALGYFLDGQVSLVFGTHTHVQTADETIFPKGTAFITDLGMCGPLASVLGMDSQVSIDRFVTGMKHSYEVASGPVELCGVVVRYDPQAKRAISIKRVREIVQLTT
jgi:metallophosphoesterase (TIGR00282 family)